MNPAQRPAVPAWLFVSTGALALLAAGVSGYLLTQSSGGPVAGCDGFAAFDCGAALQSQWSAWIGVPVSLLGVLCYATVLLGTCLVGRKNASLDAAGWVILELLTPAILGSVVWFIGLQVTGAAPSCLYCLVVHASGAVIAGLVLYARWVAGAASSAASHAPVAPMGLGPTETKTADGPLPPPSLGLPTLGGLIGFIGLAAGQVLFPPTMQEVDLAGLDENLTLTIDVPADEPAQLEDADESDADDAIGEIDEGAEDSSSRADERKPRYKRRAGGSNRVKVLRGQLEFDLYDVPLLGSPDADHVVIELMDYACPKCREFHGMLDKARERYGDQLAIVVLPVPGELLCNKYVRKVRPKARGACRIAELSVAVSEAGPEHFERIHAYLLDGDFLPNFTSASIFAKQHVDADELSSLLQGDRPGQRVESFIGLYAKLAQGQSLGLPCQIVGDGLMQGAPASVDELCEVWEERLGLQPISAE